MVMLSQRSLSAGILGGDGKHLAANMREKLGFFCKFVGELMIFCGMIRRFLVTALVGAVGLIGRAEGPEVSVLQWNIWQEGTMVPGGAEAIVDEIARLQPDFVTLSEVRNYRGVDYTASLVRALKERGVEYYSFRTYDSGLLSRYPITDSLTVFPENGDHGSIYRLLTEKEGRRIAVYTAHLDYLNDAYYDARGYDGSTWKERPLPASVEEILERNVRSQRDDATRLFIDQARKDMADGYSVVLGGDFNEPSHRDWTAATANMYDHNGFLVPWTVTTLLEEAGMVDTYRAVYPDVLTHPGFTYPSDVPAKAPAKVTWAPKADERDRIDYIWVSPDVEIMDAAIFGPKTSIAYGKVVEEAGADRFIEPLGVWPTDHKGLLVRLRLPNR